MGFVAGGDFVAGGRVSARGLPWDLIEVAQAGAQQRLRLRCASGDLRGLEWDILYPNEQVEVVCPALRPDAPGPLASWRLHHIACLLEQVPGPDDMLAAAPGRVTIEPYQLVPLMRALEMPRPRLLLADGVGLGKTIQAGLIATELIARRRAHRILVVSPAGPLLMQWEHELRQRFGLRFMPVTDAATLQRERRRIELGGNPFDSIALCLVSLDFAKQERVLEDLERSSWDLAIIDEAHHCIGESAGTDRDDTLRRRLAEMVARRSDGLLLLTATPHDGYDAHFASLIELLDPSLVDGRGGLAGLAYRRHVVRRLKSHIRNPTTGEPLFRERMVTPVRIELRGVSARPVQAFHTALAALVAPRLRRAKRIGDYADALAFIGLLKRSVSTVAACVNTLQVVAERYRLLRANGNDAEALRKERARALRAYRRRRLRFGVLDAAAENTAAALEVEDMAADLCSFGTDDLSAELRSGRTASRHDADKTVDALEELMRLGADAGRHDPKLNAMLDEVRLIRAAHPATNVLIYTEYADSQAASVHALRHARGIVGEVLAISGTDPDRERTRIAERCAEHDGIILVSTDSMAEGLNLHQRCFHLIHLDLPYNPNRLEQRNGRIDRYGQLHDPEIRYLYLAGTFEERLLLRLIAKYEKARACLAVMPDTLGVTADEAAWSKGLVAGFAEDQAALFEDDAPAIRTLDRVAEAGNAAAFRDLLHEIDRAFAGHERHSVRHGWLVEQGLNADLKQMAAADTARQRSDTLLGHIDLADFVAAAIEAETGGAAIDADRLQLPSDWTAALDDLPGYDAQTTTLRITRDRDRLRNADGEPLAFLGRAHPLVRRAVSRARRTDIAESRSARDCRVSVARGDRGGAPAVLLSYTVEIASVNRLELQLVIAVLLPVCGPPSEFPEPERWLALAMPDRAIPADLVWQRLFASWLPKRQPQAEKFAAVIMDRVAADFVRTQRDRADQEVVDLQRWLRIRADDICGAHMPRTADLFGLAPTLPDWKSLPAPLDRLAAFAADADNPPARRREATSAVALFQRRAMERERRTALLPPRLRPIGMLLLVPEDSGA
ncbi:MAG TPA: helicase-related protein [Acetobacteraceae bacterium]|nr:helicase-related protein [Acetobacteraceae bacterium]